MKKGDRKTWKSGSIEKTRRNEKIVAAREIHKEKWQRIARRFGISHPRCIEIYQREMRRRAEAGEAAA